jgi:hypothetical protein
MLTSFPPELLSIILDYLSPRTLLRLRLVSRAFLHLVTPRVFSDVSLDLFRNNFHTQFLFIKSISTSSSTVASFVKTLRIGGLHTMYNDVSISSMGPENLPVRPIALNAFLSKHLARFIIKLQNLETI